MVSQFKWKAYIESIVIYVKENVFYGSDFGDWHSTSGKHHTWSWVLDSEI